MEKSRFKVQKKRNFSFMGTTRDKDQKVAYHMKGLRTLNFSFSFILNRKQMTF